MESWRMIKEFQDSKGDDAECDNAKFKAHEVWKKSGETEFAREIMLATVNEIERIMMENRKNEKEHRV